MPDRSHLTRTPITDSLGRQTVVYRRPETVTPSRTEWAAPAARPTVVAQQTEWVVPGQGGLLSGAGSGQPRAEAAETYAERVARIKAVNDVRSFERCTEFEAEGWTAATRFRAAIADTPKELDPEAESLDWMVDRACEDGDWPLLATVGRFVDTYAAFASSMEYDPDQTSAEGPSLDDRADSALISRACTVFEIRGRLHYLDLLDATTVPEGEDAARFMAHLYAKANPSIDYMGIELDHTEHIRLLDEHYRHADQIIEWVQEDEEMTAPQIRALLEGAVTRGLSSGAL